MVIKSAEFIKGVVKEDAILTGDRPQIAFVGRSNVGKSSVINSITGQKGMARTSPTPGRTQEVNVYLINRSLYLLDLPGYGFAKASMEGKARLHNLIYWYLFNSPYTQKKVVLIIDANIGPTDADLDTLDALINADKEIVVVANKVDKIKKSEYKKQMAKVNEAFEGYKVIPFSSDKRIGIKELGGEIFD